MPTDRSRASWRRDSQDQLTQVRDRTLLEQPSRSRGRASEGKKKRMRPLDRLLGTWEFTMRHSTMSEPVTGRQRYERVLDGAFVLQHWTYDHPDFPDAMALLSDDRYHYFDVRGITRVFNLEVDEAGWTMIRLNEDFRSAAPRDSVARTSWRPPESCRTTPA